MATIEISGEFEQERSPGSVKARITFLFEPPATAPAPAPAPAADRSRGPVRVRGPPRRRNPRGQGLYRQGPDGPSADSVPIDETGRLQRIITRGLVLARRQLTAGANAAAGPLANPRGPPDRRRGQFLDLYDDPQGRFHFRHPQELEITKHDPDGIQLQYVGQGGRRIRWSSRSHPRIRIPQKIASGPIRKPSSGNSSRTRRGTSIRSSPERWAGFPTRIGHPSIVRSTATRWPSRRPTRRDFMMMRISSCSREGIVSTSMP